MQRDYGQPFAALKPYNSVPVGPRRPFTTPSSSSVTIMSTLKGMLPHAQSYLRGFILDAGLPKPMKDWMPLPRRWEEPGYSGTIPDSRIVGDEQLVTATMFDRDALASESSSSRRFVANECIGSRCPFFYFEVSIEQAETPPGA